MAEHKVSEADHGQAFYGDADWAGDGHPDTPVDLKPDTGDVVGEEPSPLEAIPVIIKGAVETRALGARRIAFRTVQGVPVAVAGVTPAMKLASSDPRRASISFMGVTGDIYVGATQASAAVGVGARFPFNTFFTLNSGQELWVSATSGTTDVSVVEQYWAE